LFAGALDYLPQFEVGDMAYVNYGAMALVAEWLQSFKEFPPRRKPASFNLDEVMRQVFNPGPGED
jgi:hypothetical protein